MPSALDLVSPLLRPLLVEAGVSSGMTVLDVGAGRGDVSLELADLVGPTGRVVALERNDQALALARERLEAYRNVEVVKGDLIDPPLGPFDAVVARRVLMYQADRPAAVKAMASVLAPGGCLVFQETDATVAPASLGGLPLHDRVHAWVWKTVEREGASRHIGFELPQLFKAAGLSLDGLRGAAIFQTAERRHFMEHIVRMMLPRMIAHGVATEEEVDVETLDARLAAELESGKAWLGEVVVSAWGRRR